MFVLIFFKNLDKSSTIFLQAKKISQKKLFLKNN